MTFCCKNAIDVWDFTRRIKVLQSIEVPLKENEKIQKRYAFSQMFKQLGMTMNGRRLVTPSTFSSIFTVHRPQRLPKLDKADQWSRRIRQHYSYSHAGKFEGFTDADSKRRHVWSTRHWLERGFTVGIGGPVGSGKTALVLALTKAFQKTPLSSSSSSLQERTSFPPLGVVTNDIFTQEDAEFLIRHKALPAHCIRAVETGGCPHAAIREDVSANLTALEQLTRQIVQEVTITPSSINPHSSTPPPVPLLFCESGGDNLAAQFSSELADFTIYVIDVAGGDKIPRKGGPGITQSDLLIINKVDLAPAVGADLSVMKRDAERMRTIKSTSSRHGNKTAASNEQEEDECGPIVFASIRHGQGVEDIQQHILRNYELAVSTPHGHPTFP